MAFDPMMMDIGAGEARDLSSTSFPPSPPASTLPPRLNISEEQRAYLARWICEAIGVARTDSGRQALLQKLALWNRAYEGVSTPKTFPWDGAANVWVPVTIRAVRGVAVRLSRAVLLAEPMVLAQPIFAYDPDQVEAAKRKEAWMQRQLLSLLRVHEEDCIGRDLILNAVKESTGVSQLSWRAKTLRSRGYQARGEEWLEVEQEKRRVGPELEFVPLEDFEVIPANARSLKSCVGIMRRLYVRWDDLARGEKAGYYRDIDRVKTPASPSAMTAPVRTGAEQAEGISPGPGTRKEEQEFQVYEGIWRWDVDGDGVEETLLVSVALDDGVLLRADYYPYLHNEPFFQLWRIIRRPARLYGQSIADMVSSLQEEINAIHNQRLDSITICLAPVIKGRRGSIVGDFSSRKVPLYPGQFLWCDDPDGITRLDLGTVNPAAFTEEALLERYTEDVSGITGMKLGRPAAGRRTWGEISQVMMESNATLDEMVATISSTLPNLAYQVESLFRQFGGDSSEDLSFLDVPVLYIPNGNLANANKQQATAMALQRYSIIIQNPLVASDPTRIWAVTRDLLNELDVKDPESYIGRQEQARGGMMPGQPGPPGTPEPGQLGREFGEAGQNPLMALLGETMGREEYE